MSYIGMKIYGNQPLEIYNAHIVQPAVQTDTKENRQRERDRERNIHKVNKRAMEDSSKEMNSILYPSSFI